MRGSTFDYANTNACTYCHADTNGNPNAYSHANPHPDRDPDSNSHTNTDGHTFSDTYANARKRFGPNAKSDSRIDLYFFKHDLQLDRR